MLVQSCTETSIKGLHSYVLQPGLDACYVKEPSHDSTSVRPERRLAWYRASGLGSYRIGCHLGARMLWGLVLSSWE